jgi:hypothetical protein
MISYEDFVLQMTSANEGFLVLFLAGLMIYLLFYWVVPFNLLIRRLNFPELKLQWILLLALLLRLPLLRQSFWYDESFTSAISRLPLVQALTVIISDVHPPLSYLPFWIVGQVFGTVPILLRLPSLLAGLAVVWALWRLGKQWGEDCGKLAALLGALMPALLWYSTEARAYIFLVLAVLIALIGLEEKRPLIVGASLGLLPLLHVYGYLYAGFLGLYALWQKVPLKILIAAAIPALLWLPVMMFQASDVADGFWLIAPNLGAALLPLVNMQIGSGYPPEAALVAIPLIVAVSVFALRANVERSMLLYWLVAAAVPLTAFVISVLWHPIYLPRAILPAMTILIIFYARWIVSHRPVAAALLWLALAIVLPFKLLDPTKDNLSSFVAACGVEPIYAISIESAIIADAYSNQPIILSSDWNNLNQSLKHYGVEALGYEISNLPGSHTCLYWQDTPMTSESQRVQRDFVVAALSLTCERLLDKPYYVVEVCR